MTDPRPDPDQPAAATPSAGAEGYGEGKWVVLDYADILVHIFYPEERKYYNMERLWDENDSAIRYSAIKEEEEREKARA